MANQHNLVAAISVSLCAAVASSAHAGSVIYVNAAASPGGDGASWKTAFDDLQDGLTAATPGSGDQLWVAAGLYKPAGAGGDRAISFNLASGTAIYGGFDGTETQLEEREPQTNITILSGDLNGDDVGRADDPSHAENSYHVVRGTNTGGGTILDGVTITGGNSDGALLEDRIGAGARFVAAQVQVVNCSITANTCLQAGCGVAARDGGAVSILGSSIAHNRSVQAQATGLSATETTITISGCDFSHNVATTTSQSPAGGAMLIIGCTINVTDCQFQNNRSFQGGAVQLQSSTGTLDGCVFKSNNARLGGGLVNFTSVPVSNCQFIDNHAETFGGGASAIADGTWTNCVFIGNTSGIDAGGFHTQNADAVLTNCLFSGNHAERGGAANFRFSSGAQNPITLDNCTFSENTATLEGGGVFRDAATVLHVANSILWNNSDSYGSGEGSQLAHGVTTIGHFCVQGWTGALGGVGNFGLDPQFIDAAGPDDIVGTEDDNLRLSATSPCINRGDPFAPAAYPTDIDGQPRVQECIVDLGAYESTDADRLEPDCNKNGVQDACDLAAGTVTDCNFNVVPDACDIAGGFSQDFDANGIPDECQGIPANDTCGVATLAQSGSTNFTTVHAATDGPDEPAGCGFGGATQIDNDIWYRYPATCAGTVTISLCNANFDARLAVYVGCPSGSGQMIACNDNVCGQAPHVSFANSGFTLYRVRIGGANGAIGGGTMVLSCTAAPLCPADVAPVGWPNGTIDIDDLLLIINNWGTANADADIDDSGVVDIDDLLAIVNAWGACP